MKRHQIPKHSIERFWKNVSLNRDPNSCWEGLGGTHIHGYGRIFTRPTRMGAHRFSYLLHKGNIPKHLFVCHTCDNRKCVNPDHLWLGTLEDNNHDRHKKGRTHNPRGEKHGNAKISDREALEIRKLAANGISTRDLMTRFPLKKARINQIIRRYGFTHI